MRALSERTVTLVASLWRNSMTEQEQCEQDLKNVREKIAEVLDLVPSLMNNWTLDALRDKEQKLCDKLRHKI